MKQLPVKTDNPMHDIHSPIPDLVGVVTTWSIQIIE